MKASKFFSPLLVGLLMGWFLCQPAPVFAVVATGTGGGTTLTDSASLRSALSDETGTGVAVFDTSPTFTTGMTITGGTVTSSSPVITATQTWNNGSNSFDGLLMQITSTAASPASYPIHVEVGGSTIFALRKDGYLGVAGLGTTIFSESNWQAAQGVSSVVSSGAYAWSSNSAPNGAADLYLYRDAAGTLGLRNSTAAQAFGIYNTYTSSTNQEKYQTAWSSNVCYTGTKAGSTSGSNRLEVHHGGAEKTLTESSATAFAQVAVASGASVAGRVDYQICADDSTDFQTRSGSVHFSGVNKAGTETATLGTVLNESVAASTGTLTVTFDTDTSPTNAFTIRANAVSSLTQTTLKIIYRVELFGPQVTVTPQ